MRRWLELACQHKMLIVNTFCYPINESKGNKKPTNWLSQAKCSATQLENHCRIPVSLVGDLASNRDRIIWLFCQLVPFDALLCSIQLHVAAEKKQLLTSYLACLWGRLSWTMLYNFVILVWTIPEKFDRKPLGTAFSGIFFAITADRN